MKRIKGFTLIELLIVIAILAILAAIIFVAVDPAQRIQDARDANRWSSVNSVLNAYLNYVVDNRGHHTNISGLTAGTAYMISDGSAGTAGATCAAATTANRVNMQFLVDQYIADIPVDPDTTSYGAADAGYYLIRSANNRITVGACAPEGSGAISVQR